MKKVLLLSVCMLLSSCGASSKTEESSFQSESSVAIVEAEKQMSTVEFSVLDARYRFSGRIPWGWEVEYIPGIQAINIFDPTIPATEPLEQSQIFIRFFEADQFLTLSTVDIKEQERTSVQGHDATRYYIQKKEGIAPFVGQPSWRSKPHRLIDIRYASQGRTFFYVFSYTPALDPQVFERFIQSLRFHNDVHLWVDPLTNLQKRPVIKPFGLFVTPENSPVDPERFSGYHTGIDFEELASEKENDIPVFAMCGGPLRSIRTVNGYGGVVIQECQRDAEIVTVLYGHLRIRSVPHSIGTYVVPGQQLGVLGTEYSDETDGERRHLHLAIHRGPSIELRGYVDTMQDLEDWIDPSTL